MRRSAALLLVSALFVAACSDDGGSDDDAVETQADETVSTQPVSTSPVAETAAETADTVSTETTNDTAQTADTADTTTDTAATDATDPASTGDQGAAEEALLVLTDFPTGWTEVPDVDKVASEAVENARAAFRACFGSEEDDLLDLGGARAETGEFTGPDDETVANVIAIADDETVTDVMARYGADGVEDCLTQRAGELIEIGFAENPDVPDDMEVGDVTVGRMNVAPAGDEVIAYRVAVPLSTEGFTFNATMDQILIRVGNGLSGLEFSTVVESFTPDDVDRYIALSVERLTAALEG